MSWTEVDKTDEAIIDKYLSIYNNQQCIVYGIGFLEEIDLEQLKRTMRKEDCHMYYYEDADRQCISMHKYNSRYDADIIFQWWDTLPENLHAPLIDTTRRINHEQILVILNNHKHRAVRRSKMADYIRENPLWKIYMGNTREEELVKIRAWAKDYGLKITELEFQVEYELI